MTKLYKLLTVVILISSLVGACRTWNIPSPKASPTTQAPDNPTLVPSATVTQPSLVKLQLIWMGLILMLL